MSETVYTRGKPGELPEIIDFINFVFSQEHCPHDFKKLLPKVYGQEAPAGAEKIQFLARKDGRIVADIANKPELLTFGDHTLKCGLIGNVSVHPYMRGEGHMKHLMTDLLQDARAQGMDLLILGGQRQRYGYFGFENAGVQLRYTVTAANVRHKLAQVNPMEIEIRDFYESDVEYSHKVYMQGKIHAARRTETFLSTLRSWGAKPLHISYNGKRLGHYAGNELILGDESLLPKVVKRLMQRPGVNSMEFRVGPHETERIAFFSDLAENVRVQSVEMLNVLSWQNTLPALMELRGAALEDGERVLDIAEDGVFRVCAKGGKVCVDRLPEAPAGALKLTHMQAQRAFFSADEVYLNSYGLPLTWRQLPFYMSEQDGF